MSGLLRWKKLREPATRAARHTAAAAAQSRPICTRSGGVPGPPRRRSGFPYRQERHKWAGGADEFDTRRIRAEANCPRCSKHTEVLFSNRSSPSIAGAGERGCYQALNIGPSCKTADYFRPQKLVLLQDAFVEIGRVRSPDLEREGDAGAGEDERQGNRLKTSFWEALRSWYGGEPPEDWPPMPGSSESNGLAVHTPPEPPFPPNLNVVRVAGRGGGGGGAGTGGGSGFAGEDGWGGANLGRICRRPKRSARGSIST